MQISHIFTSIQTLNNMAPSYMTDFMYVFLQTIPLLLDLLYLII